VASGSTCGNSGHFKRWASSALIGLYNIAMVMGGMLLLPLIVPLMATSKKRLLTFKRRLWCHPFAPGRDRGRSDKPLWVHALSVGEVFAAQPLIRQIQSHFPHLPIVLTVSTLTGFQTALQLLKGSGVHITFFPYDLILSVRRAVSQINPLAVIFIETDIWPNVLVEIKRFKVPIYLINFRFSDDTWNYYRRFAWIAKGVFGLFEYVCVQTRRDASRIQHLGGDPARVRITGNIKFDGVDAPPVDQVANGWRKQLRIPRHRQVIVAGSTHEGEEAVLLQAFGTLKASIADTLLIVAPRDPDRSDHILTLCRQSGYSCQGLSDPVCGPGRSETEIVVVDCLGVLRELYCLADAVFVGGSLIRGGGHNPLEPSACGKPVLFGPDMRDFRQIAGWLLKAGGAIQVQNAAQLANTWVQLLGDTRASKQMGRNAFTVFKSHQGAVHRVLLAIGLDELAMGGIHEHRNL
jgi:3-deoxy-D-manno-octulosonic-acid transferase